MTAAAWQHTPQIVAQQRRSVAVLFAAQAIAGLGTGAATGMGSLMAYEVTGKDPELYEALRDEGASKEKAARIANAAAKTSRSAVGRRGGKAGDYEDMTKSELLERAKTMGIKDRSKMSKDELIKALHEH